MNIFIIITLNIRTIDHIFINKDEVNSPNIQSNNNYQASSHLDK